MLSAKTYILKKSENTGRIEGGEALGGIVGEIKSNYSFVNDSSSSGAVENNSTGFSIGGLFGRLNASTYTLISKVSCKSGGSVKGDYGLGAIVGSVDADTAFYGEIKESYAECPISIGNAPRTISEAIWLKCGRIYWRNSAG